MKASDFVVSGFVDMNAPRSKDQRIEFALERGLLPWQAEVLAGLDSPGGIQDFVYAMPVNFNDAAGLLSVRRALQENRAQCMEAAFVAALALWMNGETPWVCILKSSDGEDHAITPFTREGHWGAISKSNHVWLRYRDPVYGSLRELVMSYFHEYVTDLPRDSLHPPRACKTLRAYSPLFDLSTLSAERWISGAGDCADIAYLLQSTGHYPLLSVSQEALLKERDEVEMRAHAIRQFDPHEA